MTEKNEKKNKEKVREEKAEGFGEIEIRQTDKRTKVTSSISKPPSKVKDVTKKNKGKVSLGKAMGGEFYVYPYDYPDKVFFSSGSRDGIIKDRYEHRRLFGILNKVRSYLDGEWKNNAKTEFQKKLIEAYNYKLNKMFNKKES